MKLRKFVFTFDGVSIIVSAFNHEEALILAQAEAIKNGWNHTVIKCI